MNRATLSKILNKNFNDNDTVVMATTAINNNSSQIIAALKPSIDMSDDYYLVVDKSTKEKPLVYYIPYEKILMLMKG